MRRFGSAALYFSLSPGIHAWDNRPQENCRRPLRGPVNGANTTVLWGRDPQA